MPQSAVLLPSGALGILPSGALAVSTPDGACAPCCGGGSSGGPCQCGQLNDGSGACGVPLDPARPNGPHPGMPLRVQIRLTLQALMQSTRFGITTDVYRHNAKSYEVDATYIRSSQIRAGSAPCTSRTPGNFPEQGETPSVFLLNEEVRRGNEQGQFGYASTIGDARGTVGDRAGFADSVGAGWFASGPGSYQGPIGGGLSLGSQFNLNTAVGYTTMNGFAAISSGSPLLTRERTSGLLMNASTIAQLRSVYGTVQTATYAGTQALTRAGCTWGITNQASLAFAARFGSANDLLTWEMEASWTATVSIQLSACTPTPGRGTLGDSVEAFLARMRA